MKDIKFKDWRDREVSAQKFIYDNLNGDDYGKGAMEMARDTAYNILDSYSNLIQLLLNKGILSKEDIEDTLGDV